MKFKAETIWGETIIKDFESKSISMGACAIKDIIYMTTGYDSYIIFADFGTDGKEQWEEVAVRGNDEWHPIGTRPKLVW